MFSFFEIKTFWYAYNVPNGMIKMQSSGAHEHENIFDPEERIKSFIFFSSLLLSFKISSSSSSVYVLTKKLIFSISIKGCFFYDPIKKMRLFLKSTFKMIRKCLLVFLSRFRFVFFSKRDLKKKRGLIFLLANNFFIRALNSFNYTFKEKLRSV